MCDSPPRRDDTQSTRSRRRWLTGAGAAAAFSLAGCLFTEPESSPQSSVDPQPETDAPSSSTSGTNESNTTTATPDASAPQLSIDLTAPETLDTGLEDTYDLRVTNTGETATTVTSGVDVRRPQMVFQTLNTAETTLEPDETYTSTQPIANWERGALLWTAWATAGETRVTATASTTVELSTRSWGSSYQPATGHVLSIGTPTFTDRYTGTRSDGTSVTVSATTRTQLVVLPLQVRNAAAEQRRTPDVNGFQLRTTRRTTERPHTSIGGDTTDTWTDLAPGDSEQWTLIYEVPATVAQSDLVLTHTSAGYYTDGGWQVHWR